MQCVCTQHSHPSAPYHRLSLSPLHQAGLWPLHSLPGRHCRDVCVARLGGGDFKQTALGPSQCQGSLYPSSPDRGSLLDHGTRSQQHSFSKKEFGVLPLPPPARPDSVWVPLLLSLPLGPFTPLSTEWGAVTWAPSSRQEAVSTTGS